MESSESSNKPSDIVGILEDCLWHVELTRTIQKAMDALTPVVRDFTQAISTQVVPAISAFGKAMQKMADDLFSGLAVPAHLLKDEDDSEESDE